MTPRRLPVLLIGLLVIVSLLGLGAWWLWFGRGTSTAGDESSREATEVSDASSAPAARPAQALPSVSPLLDDDYPLPVRGPGPDDRPDGPAHPHPITPRHERIFHENALIGAMNDAMDLHDAAKLRKLIRDHAESHPEDENSVREGYTVVADCMEHPGPDSTAAGQRYFDRERGSTMRRMVKRYCLEPKD